MASSLTSAQLKELKDAFNVFDSGFYRFLTKRRKKNRFESRSFG